MEDLIYEIHPQCKGIYLKRQKIDCNQTCILETENFTANCRLHNYLFMGLVFFKEQIGDVFFLREREKKKEEEVILGDLVFLYTLSIFTTAVTREN